MTTGAGRRHKLPRAASLKRRTWIRALFDRKRGDASSVASGCIRILFRFVDNNRSTDDGPRIFTGFTAGSGHPSAVKRNRIKRLLRESFRLYQHVLVEHLPQNRTLTLMILYRHHDMKSFQEIDADLRRSLDMVVTELDKTDRHG